MRYEILWLELAVDDLVELSGQDHRQALRVVVTVRTFGRDGRGDLKKLKGGRNDWRLRTGSWRVLLTLDGDRAFVTRIDNRRDAY